MHEKKLDGNDKQKITIKKKWKLKKNGILF